MKILCDACFAGGAELTIGMLGTRGCSECGETVGGAHAYHPVRDDYADKLRDAAPDMARALLAIEWSGGYVVQYDTGTTDCCPACMADAPGPHMPDCALDAALRKAGVRT